jgi:adenine deaminase
VEGLHLLPGHYFRAFLAHGTTAIVTDLHEIANAGGVAGLQWYLSLAGGVPIDLFLMAPSCVPSSPFERGASNIGIRDLRRIKGMQGVIGLGEVMDLTAVMERRGAVMRKIALFEGRPVDGHAPGLRGDDLDLYMSAGIYSDHETTNVDEGEEKLGRGMHLFLREGSASRDLDNLLGLVRPENLASLSLCTDDLSSRDLYESGHLDRLVSRLVRSGIPLFRAIRLVTINPAVYFGLCDRMGPALGRRADLVVFDNPEEMRVRATVKDGKVVFREGEGVGTDHDERAAGRAIARLNVAPFTKDDLRRRAKGERVHAIGVREGTIITDDVICDARTENGYLVPDHGRDLVFAYLFDRYSAKETYGFGLVQGFSLRNGALGTTYAHDSHNLLIVGDNLEDIHEVFGLLQACGGGMAASHRGSGLVIPMPYFGIISHLDAATFLKREAELDGLVRKMGVQMTNPFFQMSFLPLPVIPQVRLTTGGLFDVLTSRYIEDCP